MKKIYLALLTCTLSIFGMNTEVASREDLLKMQMLAGFAPSTHYSPSEIGPRSEPFCDRNQQEITGRQRHITLLQRRLAQLEQERLELEQERLEHERKKQHDEKVDAAYGKFLFHMGVGSACVAASSFLTYYIQINCPDDSLKICSLSSYIQPLSVTTQWIYLVTLIKKGYTVYQLDFSKKAQ